MKKPLIITMIMLLGLSACQKEASNVKSVSANEALTSASKKNLGTAVTQSQLVPMSLIARQPGETFDTYEAIYNGVGVKVTGPLSYDFVKYPAITDGIPVFGNVMSTYGVDAWLDYFNSGPDGNVFEVAAPTLGGLPSTGFVSDYDSYIAAYNTWFFNGGTGVAPTLATSLKTTYTGKAGILYYTGKLVLTTTGSGLAIAPVTYTMPPVAKIPLTVLPSGITVNDPLNSAIVYQLVGKSDIITSAKVFSCCANPVVFTASGSWILESDGVDFNCIGTIFRADGSSFNFNTTQNPS